MIVGITGTLGAGKGTVAEYLVREKGFVHFSVRNFIVEEIKKREMEVSRDSMTVVANDLREKFGSSYIIDQLIEQAKESEKNAIIESIRAVGEAEALREKGALLVAVDADRKIRYERIRARKSVTDDQTFESFVADEKREMDSTDPNKQNISAVMKMADVHFINNGTLEEFEKQIEAEFQKIEK